MVHVEWGCQSLLPEELLVCANFLLKRQLVSDLFFCHVMN